MTTPYAKEQTITEVKAGKQLRQRFHQPTAWTGSAVIVRAFQHDGESEPQIGGFEVHVGYHATREAAQAAMDAEIARLLATTIEPTEVHAEVE